MNTTQIFQAILGMISLVFTALVATGRLAWRTIRNWWKNLSKWLRWSIAMVLILIPVSFFARVGYMIYDDAYGRDYYWDKKISERITLRSFSDNKWRVYDKVAGEYTTGRINWLSDVSEGDSLAVYALPHKRGYININTGRIVIDAEANDYRCAWVFSDGLAAVLRDGKIGFINTQNQLVIPFQLDYAKKCRMSDFGYVFHNGYCAMPNQDGDMGLIDKSGNWVVEPVYDEIWAPRKYGYRIVIDDGKYGVLDSKCNVVYPAEYEYIDIVSDGLVLTNGGRKWQEDFDGNVVQPFMFDCTYYLNYPIGYNPDGEIQYAFADFVKYEIMNSYGIMNRITGEPVTLAIYSDINMLSQHLFEVCTPDNYDWYLLDTQGNIVPRR